jgi:hypothetical protein
MNIFATSKKSIMRLSNLIGSFCVLVLILSCQNERSNAVNSTTKVEEGLPAPIGNIEENPHADRDVTVGMIQEACQLISKDWLRRNIPGFSKNEIKLISRTAPDAHASGCECRPDGSQETFVIGYRKNPANVQYVKDLIRIGMIKQYGANVPPFRPVEGLGQIAAFSDVNGYLSWVTSSGVYIYMYLFPPVKERMEEDFKMLYTLAPEIDAKFAKFGNN